MKHLTAYQAIKRLFDICLSYIGIFVFSPLAVLSSFAVWLEDGRPIFYIQERVGKGGRLFKAIKFRTMDYKKQGSRLPLLLRTTALDEFPQLINIIKGQMSFVGPRPLVPQEIQRGREFDLRSAVPPGLTGLAQILARKDAPALEKFKYDIIYIENKNLFLDISLILRSFWISLARRWDIVNKALK